MAQETYTGVREEEVELFCEQIRAAGATNCNPVKQADGTYNVVVDFPDE